MKCLICGAEMDTRPEANQHPPPKWFGKYVADKLVAVICTTCIKVPANKARWREHDESQ